MSSTTPDVARTLEGKIAIVTGGSRGIGAGIALDLATRGAKIAIVYTSPTSESLAAEVISQIEAAGSSAIAISADLANVDSPARIVEETIAAFGPHIDILINNAAIETTKTLADITPQDFDALYSINVRAPLLLTQAIAPHLRRPGRIINISSVGSRKAFPGLSLYCSSKTALEGLTRCLAAELGKDGHTVNAVLAGPVQSAMLEKIPRELVEMQKRTTPVEGRLGTVEDMARVVAWLAGPESGWVSGQCVSASGGWLEL